MKFKIIIISLVVFTFLSCTKKEYDIEFQEGYPSMFADNWIAFEFRGGNIEEADELLPPYDLVTSIDPNRDGYLIIDKLYDADVRVRVAYADSSFSVIMGEQLEQISTNTYGIKYVCIDGYITENPVLTDFIYDLALAFFENMAFYRDDIEDVIFMRAGFYDDYQARIDTVLIIGYRKTGFENVEY